MWGLPGKSVRRGLGTGRLLVHEPGHTYLSEWERLIDDGGDIRGATLTVLNV